MSESFAQFTNTSETLKIKEKLKNLLRPVFLAAALGSSSLVAIGCDKSNSNAPEKSSPQTQQVEHNSEGADHNNTQKMTATDRAIAEEMRRDDEKRASHIMTQVEQFQHQRMQDLKKQINQEQQQSEEHSQEIKDRVMSLALKKHIIAMSDFMDQKVHVTGFQAIDIVPISAVLDNGTSIDFTAGDYSPAELQVLKDAASTNPEANKLLHDHGIVLDHNDSVKTQSTKPASGVRMGNDYDKHLNDW